MSARNFTQTLGAGETATFPAGKFFFIRVASALLDVRTQGNTGKPAEFIGIGAGSKWKDPGGQGWQSLRVTSATAQAIELVISDDGEFDVANTVSVAGLVTTQEAPNTGVGAPTFTTLATASNLDIAANLARKSLTFCALSTNTGSVFIRDQSGVTAIGIELQPGTSFTFRNTGAFRVRNNSGVSCDVCTFEET